MRSIVLPRGVLCCPIRRDARKPQNLCNAHANPAGIPDRVKSVVLDFSHKGNACGNRPHFRIF